MNQKQLIDDLFEECPEKDRCPYLQRDDISPYCTKNISGNITEKRRMVCDSSSLQLWCLNDYQKCIFYKGERLD